MNNLGGCRADLSNPDYVGYEQCLRNRLQVGSQQVQELDPSSLITELGKVISSHSCAGVVVVGLVVIGGFAISKIWKKVMTVEEKVEGNKQKIDLLNKDFLLVNKNMLTFLSGCFTHSAQNKDEVMKSLKEKKENMEVVKIGESSNKSNTFSLEILDYITKLLTQKDKEIFNALLNSLDKKIVKAVSDRLLTFKEDSNRFNEKIKNISKGLNDLDYNFSKIDMAEEDIVNELKSQLDKNLLDFEKSIEFIRKNFIAVNQGLIALENECEERKEMFTQACLYAKRCLEQSESNGVKIEKIKRDVSTLEVEQDKSNWVDKAYSKQVALAGFNKEQDLNRVKKSFNKRTEELEEEIEKLKKVQEESKEELKQFDAFKTASNERAKKFAKKLKGIKKDCKLPDSKFFPEDKRKSL